MQQVVRIFLKNKENKFLLVQHKGKEYWSLPGGHIEPGETIYQAIKREIKEELNLKITLLGTKLGLNVENLREKVQPICSYKLTYNEMKDKKVKRFEYIFLGEIKNETKKTITKQDDEIETYNFFSTKEIIEKIHTHTQVKEIAKLLDNLI